MLTRSTLSTMLSTRALHEFSKQPVSQNMVSHATSAAYDLLQDSSTTIHIPQTNPQGQSTQELKLPSLENFISQLLNFSHTPVLTLMSTLVYLDRLRSYMQPVEREICYSVYGIFLASLVVAAKFMDDITFTNKEWADFSVIPCQEFIFSFSLASVNRAERNLLILLDWNIRITEEELCRMMEPFLSPLTDGIPSRHTHISSEALQPVFAHCTEKANQTNLIPTSGNPNFVCWEHGCNGRQFSAFKNLRRHQREKGGMAKPQCSRCGAEFTRPHARNYHVQNHICSKNKVTCLLPKPRCGTAGSLRHEHRRRSAGGQGSGCLTRSHGYNHEG